MRLIFIAALFAVSFLSFGQTNGELSTLSNQWSQAISNQDIRALSAMYADNVVCYGKKNTRKAVLRAKFDFYLKYPNFSQTIVSDIKVEKVDESRYICSFTKQYRLTDKVLEVTAYLYFVSVGGAWKIVRETDDITEKNIKPKKAVNNQIVTPNPPLDADKKRTELKDLLD